MKRTSNKIFAVLLAVALSLAAIPAFAYSVEPIFVGGKVIDERGYWLLENGNFSAGTAENFNVAYDDGLLTLRNAKINSADFGSFGGADYEINAAIGATNHLSIVLEGKNELIVNTGKNAYSCGYGVINLGGDTTVSGEGELTITLEKATERLGFYTEKNRIKITDTTVNIKSSDTRYTLAIGINAPQIEIVNSNLDINFKNEKYAVGIYAVPADCYARIYSSTVDISVGGCDTAYGINIYSTDIKNSTVDIEAYDCANIGYGIFSYLFDCFNSYVDAAVKNSGREVSAIAYNRANINNGKNQIYTGSAFASITPEDAEYSAVYINSFTSVYNPMEGVYGGYFRTDNGLIRSGTKNNWNIHFDVDTNTLTLKDAKLDQVLRIIGKVNIVLKGENIINAGPSSALISDFHQNFSGSGSLTLISTDTYAYYTPEDVIFGSGVVVTASPNADGSNATSFAGDLVNYKWINIQGTDEPEEEPPAKLTFWQKIINFFKSIADFFKGLFA